MKLNINRFLSTKYQWNWPATFGKTSEPASCISLCGPSVSVPMTHFLTDLQPLFALKNKPPEEHLTCTFLFLAHPTIKKKHSPELRNMQMWLQTSTKPLFCLLCCYCFGARRESCHVNSRTHSGGGKLTPQNAATFRGQWAYCLSFATLNRSTVVPSWAEQTVTYAYCVILMLTTVFVKADLGGEQILYPPNPLSRILLISDD